MDMEIYENIVYNKNIDNENIKKYKKAIGL